MPEPDRHVHIVDDDRSARASTAILLHANDFTTDQWSSGRVFLKAVPDARTGCVLLDLHRPGIEGVAVMHDLARRGVAMPVVVLTGDGDVDAAVRAMKAGAVDVLEKPVETSRLIAALDTALEGVAARRSRAAAAERARAAVASLTPRERDVLQGLACGLSNKGIALDLAVSARTVEIHRANLMAKLETRALSRALRIAFIAGLGEPLP